jgi:hypothetical protein
MAQSATFKPRHLAWVLMLIPLLGGGCAGINASKSISPLDFLMPGLLRNDPVQPANPAAAANSLVCWSGGFAPLATE